MAVLMYTFGVFVQCEELRINVRMPFACAVTDAISLLCMGEKKAFLTTSAMLLLHFLVALHLPSNATARILLMFKQFHKMKNVVLSI